MNLSLYYNKLIWGSLWVSAHIGLFVWAYFEELYRTDNTQNKSILGIYLFIARGAARCLNFDMACILLPVSRTFFSYIKKIPYLGKLIPFDKHIKFHMIVAYTMIIGTAVHTLAHLFNIRLLNTADPSQFNIMLLSWTTWAGTTGHIMIVILFLIITSAAKPVKKQCFELFWYIHHLFWLFFFSALTHALSCILKTDSGVCYKKTTWQWTLLGLSLYSIEVILRWIRAFQSTKIRKIVAHPSRTFEIQFIKTSMKSNPGEYIHVNIPEISRTQWHPFTLTSCREEGYHSVHIRVVGDWTKSFAKLIGCMDEKENWLRATTIDYSKLPRLRIDGPFGTPSEEAFNYPIAVMIGGGIGVTPFASLLKHLWFTIKKPEYSMKLRKVYFVWIARETKSFEWFQKLLSSIESENVDNLIDIQIYVTKKLSDNERANIFLFDDIDGKDPITHLRSKTKFGRPNISDVYNRVKAENHGEEKLRVGVFFCGPPKLGTALRVNAHKASDKNCHFQFTQEIF